MISLCFGYRCCHIWNFLLILRVMFANANILIGVTFVKVMWKHYKLGLLWNRLIAL